MEPRFGDQGRDLAGQGFMGLWGGLRYGCCPRSFCILGLGGTE